MLGQEGLPVEEGGSVVGFSGYWAVGEVEFCEQFESGQLFEVAEGFDLILHEEYLSEGGHGGQFVDDVVFEAE